MIPLPSSDSSNSTSSWLSSSTASSYTHTPTPSPPQTQSPTTTPDPATVVFTGPLDVENADRFALAVFSLVRRLDGTTRRFSDEEVTSLLGGLQWDPIHVPAYIGKGTFGVVYQRVEVTHGLCASKQVTLSSCEMVEEFVYEALTLAWVDRSAQAAGEGTPALRVYSVGFGMRGRELVGQLVTELCHCTLTQRLGEQAKQVRLGICWFGSDIPILIGYSLF